MKSAVQDGSTTQQPDHAGPETQPDWLTVARLALLSRCLDRTEIERLTPQGLVKYQFSAGGHELAQILLAQALEHPHDAAAVYYRSRPFVLAAGMTPAEALAAGMARRGSPSQGRDVGVVYNLPRRGGPTVLPASGAVGAQYTPAAGWAQAVRYRAETLGEKAWQGALAVALGGDGSVAANGFWAALNMATTLRLPLIFFIEDNHYGLSAPAALQTPGGQISANLRSFQNLLVLDGDGAEPQEAWQRIAQAVAHVRSGEGPCLLRLDVPRLEGHTFIDDQSYKSAGERQAELGRDPLPRLRAFLLEQGHTAEEWAALEAQAQAEVEQAVEEALAQPEPGVDEMRRHMFFEGVPPQQGGLRPEVEPLPLEGAAPETPAQRANLIGAAPETPGQRTNLTGAAPEMPGQRTNLISAVARALAAEMQANPRLLVFGEDVGRKGGVHGATAGLQKRFGEARVFDTSLSEEGIIGRAAGMALAGLLPVPEIQFRKYADPATEQLNDLGTLRWRTANRFAAPLVVRIPVGYGRVTGDPWHSVSGEAVYAHSLGWRIAYPSNAADAAGLLRTALRSDDPTFFLEHRALLDAPEARRPYPGDGYCLPFGKAARVLEVGAQTRQVGEGAGEEGADTQVRPYQRGSSAVRDEGAGGGPWATVVTWGALVYACLQAAQAFPGQIDLLDLRTIVPWDQAAVLASVARTGRLLVVHEDTLTAGFGGEIVAVAAAQAFTHLDAPPERLAMPDLPVPFNPAAMHALLPSAASIQARLQSLLAY